MYKINLFFVRQNHAHWENFHAYSNYNFIGLSLQNWMIKRKKNNLKSFKARSQCKWKKAFTMDFMDINEAPLLGRELP